MQQFQDCTHFEFPHPQKRLKMRIEMETFKY